MGVSSEMGGLLWRRVYEAEAQLQPNVTLLSTTLRALLEQAGIVEPEDDLIFGPCGEVWHGRTRSRAVPTEGGQ